MSQIVRSTPNRRPTHLQAGEGRPRPADPRQRMEEGKVSSSARPPLTARRRSAMSEMRPVTEREVRDAAERLRQTKAAEDATDVAGVEAGSAPRCSIKASQTAPGPVHGWAPKPCGNEWRDYWKSKGRSDLLPGAHWDACQ